MEVLDSIHNKTCRKGFSQSEGIDYTKTFAAVVKYVALRLLLAHATRFGWPVDQLDVGAAFLYGLVKKSVFIRVPEGMNMGKSLIVWNY